MTSVLNQKLNISGKWHQALCQPSFLDHFCVVISENTLNLASFWLKLAWFLSNKVMKGAWHMNLFSQTTTTKTQSSSPSNATIKTGINWNRNPSPLAPSWTVQKQKSNRGLWDAWFHFCFGLSRRNKSCCSCRLLWVESRWMSWRVFYALYTSDGSVEQWGRRHILKGEWFPRFE